MADFRDIIIDGKNMRKDFGLYLKSGHAVRPAIEYDVDVVPVEGSAVGDFIVDNKTENNIEYTYSFRSIPSKIPQNDRFFVKTLKKWINDIKGKYVKLMDTEHEGCYNNAYLVDVGDVYKNFEGCYDVELTFSLKSFWYLSVEKEKGLDVSDIDSRLTYLLKNPEGVDSYPFISLSRTDSTTAVNLKLEITTKKNEWDTDSTVYTYTLNGTGISIDSEASEIISNGTVTGYAQDFPILQGYTEIEVTPVTGQTLSGTWQLIVYPRWRGL